MGNVGGGKLWFGVSVREEAELGGEKGGKVKGGEKIISID